MPQAPSRFSSGAVARPRVRANLRPQGAAAWGTNVSHAAGARGVQVLCAWRAGRPLLRRNSSVATMAPGLASLTRLSVFGALAGAALLADCRSPFCTLGIVEAVQVEVRDSVTLAPAASGAFGTVQDGAFVDSLHPRSFLSDGTLLGLGAAEGRPGIYAVLVRRPGYRDWQASGVVARSGECGVIPASLHARLQALP